MYLQTYDATRCLFEKDTVARSTENSGFGILFLKKALNWKTYDQICWKMTDLHTAILFFLLSTFSVHFPSITKYRFCILYIVDLPPMRTIFYETCVIIL